MKKFFENIGISIVSNIIFAVVAYLLQEKFDWNLQIPLWLCFVIAAGAIFIKKMVCSCIRQYKIYNAIKTFTQGYFGNSYRYKWEYVKNPNGLYGYEPINIQVAESHTIPDPSNTKVYIMGHSVEEQKIKLMIRLTLIGQVEEGFKEKIQPILDYLHWTEEK